MGDSARPFLPTFNDQVQPHACFAKASEHFKTRLAEQGIQAVNQIPKNLPTLKSDGVLLDRMMGSLFEEALLTLPPGSTLQMDGVKESDQLIRLQISYGTPGLQLEKLKWIFDPFETLEPSGPKPGLHLMAAFLVVYHHGGVVHSTLEAGKGRVLRFHLPIDPDKMMVTEGERNFLNKMLFSESLWDEFLGQG
jgi:two-component system sensor histidine kinase KdpD